MYQNLKCIVLRTVPHSDTQSIVTLFTREKGVVAASVPGGNTREAARRRAIMMPLGIVECGIDFRPGKNVFTLRDVRRAPSGDFSSNPMKNISALFLADVLHHLLPGAAPDSNMFNFIENSVNVLASVSGTALANFHLAFLIKLQYYLGIAPDFSTFRRGYLFDMKQGFFRPTAPLHGNWLSREQSEVAMTIGRMNYSNMALFKMSRQQRNQVLDIIMDFYSLHLGNLSSLKSLEVVRSLF